MAFKLLLLSDGDSVESQTAEREWPARLKAELPEIEVHAAISPAAAEAVIAEVDAAYGYLPPEVFAQARKLRWLASPQAGPNPRFYHQALVDSEVVVTNVAGIYNDHIGAQIMAYLLSFARGLHLYHDRQRHRAWETDAPTVYLPEARAVIVGVGGIGGEAARLVAAFGIHVTGVDPRVGTTPAGVAELIRPDALDEALPTADFVILTAPQTPATEGFFDAAKFRLMKQSAYFINIGRGATVRLDDLDAALRQGEIAGAALDVFEIEPLPATHPLWDAPGMVITPHVAAAGPYLDERRWQVFAENCRRFEAGRPLLNVVDKTNWY
jgi:phosphoglycerate dehydrogenase-like enzyme